LRFAIRNWREIWLASLVSSEFVVNRLAADSERFLDSYLKLFRIVEGQRFEFDLHGTSRTDTGELRKA
jgi:hypothetical protein